MKYKSSDTNKPKLNNMITTVNLKIKDMNILLDDVNTGSKNNNSYENQKYSTKKKYKKIPRELLPSPFTKNNSNKIYYHKRNLDSLKYMHKSMKTIPINIKRENFYINNMESPPSLSTTIDPYNNSNLTSIISKKNLIHINTDRIIYSKKSSKRKNIMLNNNSSLCNNSINNYSQYYDSNDKKSTNMKIYIKKNNNRTIHRNIYASEIIKPFLLTSGSPRNTRTNIFEYNNDDKLNFENNKTLNYSILNNTNNRSITKKKIKFNFNEKKLKNVNKVNFNKNISFIKNCITIQKWWKKMKKISLLKHYVIIIQKVIRGYLFRKYINSGAINSNNYNNNYLVHKIPKNKVCYITINYYKSILPSIISLQREIRKFLIKKQLYHYYYIERKNSLDYSFSYLMKPKINICYITKIISKDSIINNNKSLSFVNKKIKLIAKNRHNKKMKIDKENNKIILINKSSNDSSNNSLICNISGKNFNIHHNMVTIQTIDSKESQDIYRFDIFNKSKFDTFSTLNGNLNRNSFYFLQNLFKNNIFHKFYLVLLKMKYKYINFFNLINCLLKLFIKNKKKIFFEYLCMQNINGDNNNTKYNFVNIIVRHINIYQKSNRIRNDVIELIQKNIPQHLKVEDINYLNKNILLNISSRQEDNLINTQLFKNNDYNLVNYIYLFFKYEKNKDYINCNFIQNRLLKEPLKFRNIFTITRYIDNLNDNINNNKICMKCFCKINEKKCKMICKCHIIQNIINIKSLNNFLPKYKSRKCSLKKNNNNNNNDKENNTLIINKNIYFLKKGNEECNKSDEYRDSESMNVTNISGDYKVNKLHIKKAFTYFDK